MTIRQLYYTSFVDPTGRGGFRIMSRTPGIPPQAENELLRLLSYRTPANVDERAVDLHPVALRYGRLESGPSVLICAQSSGSDELGRPGNYFAHALVVDPDDISLDPIACWRSPMWVRQARADVHELPALEALRSGPPDPDRFWRFLAVGQRRAWFQAVLAAAVSYGERGRPIIVVGSVEDAIEWVAAISEALPRALRPLLTFSSYEHDPRKTPFLVTGTRPDGAFRAARNEYQHYFIVNEAENRASAAEPSSYAAWITARLEPNAWKEQVAPLLEFASRQMIRAGGAAWPSLERLPAGRHRCPRGGRHHPRALRAGAKG